VWSERACRFKCSDRRKRFSQPRTSQTKTFSGSDGTTAAFAFLFFERGLADGRLDPDDFDGDVSVVAEVVSFDDDVDSVFDCSVVDGSSDGVGTCVSERDISTDCGWVSELVFNARASLRRLGTRPRIGALAGSDVPSRSAAASNAAAIFFASFLVADED
jgi:hypothetical protein